jgi:mannose-6-phosphate isomerase-like protein (cupin superfamily)
MKVINIKSKFDQFSDQWSPKVIADLNGQHVKLAKIEGEFVWHDHKDEDELFYIVKGSLDIEFRDRKVTLQEGEMIVVPKGVEHKPIAKEECWVMLFEPAQTKHTGDVEHEMTVQDYERI